MIISLGADHRGITVLTELEMLLIRHQHEPLILAQANEGPCDYPDIAYPVARAVVEGRSSFGLLACGSGIGMSIAANKIPGIRAAVVHDEVGADMSRRHNDANIICLPADLLGIRLIRRIVEVWLSTPFEGGRHQRRIDKVLAIERGEDPVRCRAAR